VVDEVREFYCCGCNETGMLYNEAAYTKDVLSRAGKKFCASLLWLVEHEAITLGKADRLEDIYNHRHDLTHELGKYIVDPDFEPDMDLFIDALTSCGTSGAT
jgi:hypothetical protein